MPVSQVKFKRTMRAATNDRLSKWGLIEAIGEDAEAAGLAVLSADSVVAARGALNEAGCEYADATVRNLCVVAKFHAESTREERALWRTYGWTIIQYIAGTGWSHAKAAKYLGSEHRTWHEVRHEVAARRPVPRAVPALDDRWAQWVQRAAKVMMDGATLMADSEGVHLGSHSEMAAMIYQSMSDRQLDAEIRRLLDSEGVR